MKQTIQLALFMLILLTVSLSGCSYVLTPVQSATIPSTVPPTFAPEPIATQTPLPTTVAPVWTEISHVDLPFEYSSPDGFYYEKAISGAEVSFDTDTRWNIDVQVDKLREDIGESSTGILLRGLTKSGDIASLYLVYQYGFWSVGYSVNKDFSYWQSFEKLTEPVQSFEISISNDGEELSIQNRKEFKFKHQMPVILFPDKGTIQFGAQIAPHTKISLSKLVVDQLRSPAVSLENSNITASENLSIPQIDDETNKIVFDYYKSGYENDFPVLKGDSNVFASNLDGTNLTPITNGFMLYNHVAGVSPDGQKILIQTAPANYTTYEGTSGIYVVDLETKGSEPIKLASGVFDLGRTTAAWLDNSHIVFIDLAPGGMAIFSINIDGTDRKRISQRVSGILTGSLLLTNDKSRVFWEGFAEEGRRWYYKGIWWTSIDGSEQSKLSQSGVDQDFHLESISPDGSMVVWTKLDDMTWKDCYIYVASISEVDRPTAIKFNCYGSYNILWSPDSSKVFLDSEGYIETSSGFTNPNSAYILSSKDLTVREFKYPTDNMLFSVHVIGWSPDSQRLLVKISKLLDSSSTIGLPGIAIKILNLDTKTFSEIFTNNISKDAIGQAYWLIELK